MIFQNGGPKNICVVKFTGHIDFHLDSESLRNFIQSTSLYKDKTNITALKAKGKFKLLETGREDEDSFLIFFEGFFKGHIEGRIWVPTGVGARDYDKYVQGSPYLLTFNLNDLELFTSKLEM